MTRTPEIRRTGRLLAVAVAASIAIFPLVSPAAAHPAKNKKLGGMVTSYRQNNGLNKLKHNKVLKKKAHKHAKNLSENGYLYHSKDSQLVNYMKGAKCSVIAENVGFHPNSLFKLQQAFKDSPAHDMNLLDPRWKKMGMGVHVDDKGWLWATQIFCA